MKLTSSGRTHSAAMIRSPSFSRSSSSMMTAIFPWRRSSRISSIVLNAAISALGSRFGHEPFKIARNDIDFDVYFISRPKLAQRRDGKGMRNDVDIEMQARNVVDGQADPVDADRSLCRHEPREIRRQLELHAPGSCVLRHSPQRAQRIHVAADQVSAERIARPQTGLEIDVRADAH